MKTQFNKSIRRVLLALGLAALVAAPAHAATITVQTDVTGYKGRVSVVPGSATAGAVKTNSSGGLYTDSVASGEPLYIQVSPGKTSTGTVEACKLFSAIGVSGSKGATVSLTGPKLPLAIDPVTYPWSTVTFDYKIYTKLVLTASTDISPNTFTFTAPILMYRPSSSSSTK